MKIAKDLTELVGRTPLVELSAYGRKHGLKARIVAKVEQWNPSGSVKARAELAMIEDALCIAIEAHEGEKDLDGNPVILHPLTVGLAGHNREEIVTGFLHDVI